jgi:uncharacterized protein
LKLRRIFSVLFLVLLAACNSNEGEQPSSQDDMEFGGGGRATLNEQFISSAEVGDTERVLQLLQEGADINATDKLGRTAVVAATYQNEVDTVKALIQEGANINIQDNQLENVILNSGANGNLEIVRLAINAGADMTITNRFGGTALIPAAERGHVEVVKELLTTSDIDVNHINRLHWTALLEAVILGDGGDKHQKIVQLLVDHGADVTIGDENGITPLEHAEERGFQGIVEILKSAE